MGVLNLEGITYSNDNSVHLKRQVTLALSFNSRFSSLIPVPDLCQPILFHRHQLLKYPGLVKPELSGLYSEEQRTSPG
jgi:hypothetical protein